MIHVAVGFVVQSTSFCSIIGPTNDVTVDIPIYIPI